MAGIQQASGGRSSSRRKSDNRGSVSESFETEEFSGDAAYRQGSQQASGRRSSGRRKSEIGGSVSESFETEEFSDDAEYSDGWSESKGSLFTKGISATGNKENLTIVERESDENIEQADYTFLQQAFDNASETGDSDSISDLKKYEATIIDDEDSDDDIEA